MKLMEICQKPACFANNCKATLVYSITIDELSDLSAGISVESYGVCISIAENGVQNVVRHITCSLEKIEKLVRLLSENSVTPVTLQDVVYDWLCTV
jgi:hypothetical protein